EIRVHRHTPHHVEHVQAGQREVEREEVARAREQPVFELVAVFEILHDEEDAAKQDRGRLIDPKRAETVALERRPRHHHRHRRRNEDDRVERRERDVEDRIAARPVRHASADQDVAREERPEQHDFGRQEEPDADLAVVETGIAPNFDGVRNFHVAHASNWGWKPLAAPGALYSYGPRYACGAVTKLPCGGGDGAAHASVGASHGLSPTFWPWRMLQKKLKMNGSWKSAMIHAPHEEMTFRCSTGCANA